MAYTESSACDMCSNVCEGIAFKFDGLWCLEDGGSHPPTLKSACLEDRHSGIRMSEEFGYKVGLHAGRRNCAPRQHVVGSGPPQLKPQPVTFEVPRSSEELKS